MKIYIDTDVFLDLLAKREPFFQAAKILFSMMENNLIEGFISPLIIANIYNILRKIKNEKIAKENIHKILLLVNVLDVNYEIVYSALQSNIKDFEDAIQVFTAKNNNIELIITRNIKDYKKASIVARTPEEFIKDFADE